MTKDESDRELLEGLSDRLRKEAQDALEEEPELKPLLCRTVLEPSVESFEDAVATTVCYRLLLQNPNKNNASCFCPISLLGIFKEALNSNDYTEGGHSISSCVRQDAVEAYKRDPACKTVLEVVLFFKGFASLVCHRVARYKWVSSSIRSMTALWIQSQASAVFGVDIHPAATLGAGLLLDHGTGIVIGETAVVGDGCTFLHGVTLGGTGKESGDRHPKVGRDVFIGAGASILGNLPIGDAAKIGAGSIVLGPIPAHATAVGVPAKIIGRAQEEKPGSAPDELLERVTLFHSNSPKKSHKKKTVQADLSLTDVTTSTAEPTTEDESEANTLTSNDSDSDQDNSNGDSVIANSVCPFRDYTSASRRAPEDSLTIVKLRKMLKPYGCSEAEIGQVFFAIDMRNVGYVRVKAKNCKAKMREALETFTKLDETKIQEILDCHCDGRGSCLGKCKKQDIDASVEANVAAEVSAG